MTVESKAGERLPLEMMAGKKNNAGSFVGFTDAV